MINSRDIKELHPIVSQKAQSLIDACKLRGVNLLITSTYRDNESQNDLYNKGRTKPGGIVTNAKGGFSFHQYRVAFDVVPLVNGKAIWNDNKLWDIVIDEGHKLDLTSGTDWTSFKEKPHFQYTGKEKNYSTALNFFRVGGKLEKLLWIKKN